MSEHSADALLERLTALTDRERLEFARWAVEQPVPPAVLLGYGRAHVARVAAERAAIRALGAFRGDGSLTALPWDYTIETLPEPGWGEWEAGAAMVRAMAAALVVRDRTALARLAPAFERLRLPSPLPDRAG